MSVGKSNWTSLCVIETAIAAASRYERRGSPAIDTMSTPSGHGCSSIRHVLRGAGVALALLAGAPADAFELREVSSAWGVDFRHHHGGSGERYMVETVVGGVVIFDYDGDGDVDLFFVDGGPLPGYAGEEIRSRLFRNDGPGRFVDVTGSAGIVFDVYGCGATAGDFDNDGDLDLYVTAFGPNQLLANDGDGGFSKITEAAGVGDRLWSASAAFADVDRDGHLDLYVANYVDFTLENHKFCGDRQRNLQGYCHPSAYEGVPDRLYRNRGDGTFVDVTRESGLEGATEAGLGVAFADVDADGWPDVYVANDADPNFLFRNLGDGTFEDVSLLSGTAYDETGKAEGSMGVDFGDLDNDGWLDLVVTNFEFEFNALYKNVGGRTFIDHRFPSGFGEKSKLDLAFGVALVDLDHDGDLDIVIGNGHILDNAKEFNSVSRYAQSNRIFENVGSGRLQSRSDHGMDTVAATRGVAVGDLDLDGDLDVVVVNSNEAAEIYENRSALGDHRSIQVDLIAAAGNRHGVGARIDLVTEAVPQQTREVQTASSYLSQDSMTVHFGVGTARHVDQLSVIWPSGRRQRLEGLPAGRRFRLFE